MTKKQVFKITAFLLGLCLILGVLSIAVLPEHGVYDLSESHNALKRIENQDPQDTVDIVFAGDSEAGYGFAPLVYWKDYGYSAENIGYPNERLGDTYAMLQTILEEQSVKLLVLETDSFFADASIIANDDKVLETAEKLLPVFHYHKIWRFLKPEGSSYDESDKNANKGYWLRRGVMAYTGPLNYTDDETSGDQTITDSAAEYLEKIVELCKEKNVEIITVTTPGPSYYTARRHQLAQQWSEEHGITYLDMNFYNEEIGLDWSEDTMDGGAHMNHYGCSKMNTWFAEYLKEHYSLEDHRGEEGYESWENAYEALRSVYDGI